MRRHTAIVVLIVLTSPSGHSYGYSRGNITDQEVLLFRTRTVRYGIPFIIRSSKIWYPPFKELRTLANITALRIEDNSLRNTGKMPVIEGGGIYQQYVVIRLAGQRGKGISYTVQIYGRKLK